MKAMTIVVHFEEGQKPECVNFDSIVGGGKVTAIAAYNVVHTMEMAEETLDLSYDKRCIETRNKINEFIKNRTNK